MTLNHPKLAHWLNSFLIANCYGKGSHVPIALKSSASIQFHQYTVVGLPQTINSKL